MSVVNVVLSSRGLLRRADHSSRRILPSVVCLSVTVSLGKGGISGHWNCRATIKIHLARASCKVAADRL